MGKPFDFSLIFVYLPKMLAFLHVTLLILVVSVLLGVFVGFLIALPRLFRIPVLDRLAMIYVSFVRGTPIIIQLFLIYYGIPELLKTYDIDLSSVSSLVFVVITYGLHIGAFFSEIIRSAVSGVDRGQLEAAYAVGMTGPQAFIRIVLPQALSIAFPLFGNLVVSSLKDTSLAFSVGVMDMVARAETLGIDNHFIEIYIALSVIYYTICIILERLFAWSERRLQRHDAKMGLR